MKMPVPARNTREEIAVGTRLDDLCPVEAARFFGGQPFALSRNKLNHSARLGLGIPLQ
jgi:hypothetical protein